jgi:hypothetical protein
MSEQEPNRVHAPDVRASEEPYEPPAVEDLPTDDPAATAPQVNTQIG